MAHGNDPPTTPSPPLGQLLSSYLRQQAEAHAAGLTDPDGVGEVVPYEAGPVQPVDARLAWEEAVDAARLLAPAAPVRSWQAPPHWPQLVAQHEPVAALAFCVGNFPQLVRNLQPLLQGGNLAALRTLSARPAVVPALSDWAEQAARRQQFPQMLLAQAALRLARQFDEAERLLQGAAPEPWRAAWQNEAAALSWHRGQADEALASWLKQPTSVPVLFNRGMAALFLDRPAEARPWLTQAVGQLPDDGAWHHLGRLYLALAEMRG
jgi:tetratricopeptide (TPR) repeat protein